MKHKRTARTFTRRQIRFSQDTRDFAKIALPLVAVETALVGLLLGWTGTKALFAAVWSLVF